MNTVSVIGLRMALGIDIDPEKIPATGRDKRYIARFVSAELGSWARPIDDNYNARVSLSPEPKAVLWKV